MRERAEGAGLSMSRYLVERGLTVELPREEGVRPQLVLDDAEQRELRDRIAAVAERCRPALPKETARSCCGFGGWSRFWCGR